MTDNYPRSGREERTDQLDTETDGRATTRRAFLGATATIGGLAAGAGAVQGWTETLTDDGRPEPPANLGTTAPPSGGGIELSWTAPPDPCTSGLSHYVVTLNGDVEKTVPAGVSRTILRRSEGVVGVSAVDESGNQSSAATTEAGEIISDPPYTSSVELNQETLGVGESVRASVSVGNGTRGVPEFDSYEITVEVSTPCAVSITDAEYPDGVETTEEPSFADDGSAVTLSASGVEAAAGGRQIATIELTGQRALATELSVTDVTMESDEGTFGAVPDWTTIEVERAQQTGPEAPSNLRTQFPKWSSWVPVLWDGPANPCEAAVDHYVVTFDDQEKTVPAGVTRTSVYVDGEKTIGIRAVDADGNESPTVETRVENNLHSDPAYVITPKLDRDTIAPGETVDVTLDVSAVLGTTLEVPESEFTVSLSTPCAAMITDATYSEENPSTGEPSIAEDGSSVTVPSSGGVPSVSIELEGQNPGGTEIHVSVTAVGDSSVVGLTEDWSTLTVEEGRLPAVDGTVPQDIDGDGRYMDLNANGRIDSDDVATYFQHTEEPALTNNTDAYDYNRRIDFDDVRKLFTAIE